MWLQASSAAGGSDVPHQRSHADGDILPPSSSSPWLLAPSYLLRLLLLLL